MSKFAKRRFFSGRQRVFVMGGHAVSGRPRRRCQHRSTHQPSATRHAAHTAATVPGILVRLEGGRGPGSTIMNSKKRRFLRKVQENPLWGGGCPLRPTLPLVGERGVADHPPTLSFPAPPLGQGQPLKKSCTVQRRASKTLEALWTRKNLTSTPPGGRVGVR